jgi:AraC-like DNA-binding protein
MNVFQPVLKYLKDFGFKSLFYKMFISILLCMIVPVLLVGFFSYRNSSNVLIDQAVEQKSKSVEQINLLLNNYFQRIEEATWSQYNNPWIKDISSYPFSYDEINSVLKCMGYMQADTNKANIYDLFIYISTLDRFVTSSLVYDNQDFFLKKYGCSLEKSNALTQAMKDQHYNEYIPFMGNFDEFVYPYNVPPDEPAMMVLTTLRVTGQPVIQVGAVVRRASIEGMLTDKLSGGFESLSLMDGTGNANFHVGASYSNDQDDVMRLIGEMRGAASGSAHSILRNGDADYLVNYIKNPETGYYIVSQIPMSVILERTQSIKSVVWILSLIALVLSLCVSFLLSVFFYRPVAALLDSMQAGGGADGQKKPARARKDEYSLINRNYTRMTSEYSAMKDLMNRNRAETIARFFRRLCQSKYNNPAEIQERLQDVALSYERKKFAVHVISPDGLGRESEADLAELEEIYRKMGTAICAAMEPALDAQVVAFTEYEALCVVINHDKADEALAQWANAHYREIFAAYGEQRGISFSVGLGLSVGDLGQLKASYDQARESVDSRFFSGYGKIHAYEAQAGEAIPYTVSEQESLLNAILQGDRKEALEQVVPVLRLGFSERRYNASEIKRLMREMLSVVLDAFHEENIPLSTVFGEGFDLFYPIDQLDTFDSALDFVREIVEDACLWIQENRQKATETQRDVFMAYIEAHYAEEIMLQTIAQQFHFSPSYFSRYFKMVTGSTFIDCITQVRIKKAKEMLSDGGVAIKDVYPEVGYNNYNTFRRAFKKIVGMSPESYKRNSDQVG